MKPFPAMPVQIYFPAADLITLIHKNTNICVLHLHNNQSGLDAVPSKILKSEA
jgi:hypothetical protein